MAVRTFSMSAGLDASTATPGSTAPEVSRTLPASVWAEASVVLRRIRQTEKHKLSSRFFMGPDYEGMSMACQAPQFAHRVIRPRQPASTCRQARGRRSVGAEERINTEERRSGD